MSIDIDGRLREQRLKKLIDLIEDKSLGALILTKLENVRYAIDIRPIHSIFHIDQYLAILTPDQEPVLLSSEADKDYVQRNFPWVQWIPLPSFVPSEMIVSVKAQKIAKVLKRIFFHDKKVGYDSLSLELFKELKKRIKVTFIPIEYEILKCRAIKEEAEIAIMERTVQLAGIGMEAVRRSIRPGIAEFELAAEAIYAMKRAGAEAESHMPAIRSGENAEHLQRFDSERRLIPGDAVIVDLGARYRGYSAEYCRTMIVDRPRKELKEIYKVLFEAYQQGIEEIKPGTLTQKIDHTIRRAITKAGYPDYPHATGHGIGMANAEYPPINRTSKVPLEEGMIICVEPGIYLPGVGAVKEEDVILVTHRGHRVLTQTPYDERLVR